MTKKFVNIKSINQLKEGDIVKLKSGGPAYVVTGNYGDRATAVRSVDLTNPREGQVFKDEIPLPPWDAKKD